MLILDRGLLEPRRYVLLAWDIMLRQISPIRIKTLVSVLLTDTLGFKNPQDMCNTSHQKHLSII